MTTGEKLKAQLSELSRNLWWAWNPHIIKLFRDLDAEAFRAANHNPVSVLAGFSAESIDALARDADLGVGERRPPAGPPGRLLFSGVRDSRVAADLQRRSGRAGGRPPQERVRPRAAAGGGGALLPRVLLPPAHRPRRL